MTYEDKISSSLKEILSNTKPILERPMNVELFLDNTGLNTVNIQIAENVDTGYTISVWNNAGDEMDSVELEDEVCVDVTHDSVIPGLSQALIELEDALRTQVDMIIDAGHDFQRQAELEEYWADEKREEWKDEY